LAKHAASTQPTVANVAAAVDRVAPARLAESWDNVGLQIGDPGAPAGRVLVALEVTREVIAEAKRLKARTLVTHHPLLFRPLKSLVEDSSVPALASELIRSGMAMIAAHTNFDAVAWGTNGVLADVIELRAAGRGFLMPISRESSSVKYVVYTPASHVTAVVGAIASAGAGEIGNYSHCTFRAPGTGTFRPLAGANPHVGAVGRLEEAEEARLECLCPRARLGALIAAVRKVHPYEEIAFDILSLQPEPGADFGYGLVGELKEKSTIAKLVALLKRRLGIDSVGLVGDAKKSIERIAILTGAGGEAIRRWRPGSADLLVTGEMTHHDCAEAHHRGVPVLLVGHWTSEAIATPRMAELLTMALAEEGFPKADVRASARESNPLKRI